MGFLQAAESSVFVSPAYQEEQPPAGQSPSAEGPEQSAGSVINEDQSPEPTPVAAIQFASHTFPWFSLHHRFRPLTVIGSALIIGAILGAILGGAMLHDLSVSSAHQQAPTLYSAATSGTPVLSDPLVAPDNNQWDSFPNSCIFQDRSYHLLNTHPGTFNICKEEANTFCNFAFQAEMTIISGDGGGLIFRLADGAMERFRVSSNGSYDFVDPAPNGPYGISDAVHQGLGKSNILTSIAQGSTIDIYINGQHIGNLQHSQSPACGQIGFLALDFSQSADVQFSNVKVWNLN